jgi:DNA-binding FadR family transcriptional regulator
MIMARGNAKNLKPRTQEGLQAALVACVAAGDSGAVRKAMMKHGYMAKVVVADGRLIATSGDLRAEVDV